jgi:dTDP-glucose pyrophosphorylase
MIDQQGKRDWKILSLSPESTLRDAMVTIDQGHIGIALIVDDTDHLQGTVTDGDLRRAILRGVALDHSVSLVMNRNFVAGREEMSTANLLELMRIHSIKQVPLLDSNGRIVGIHNLSDLVEPLSLRPNWAVIMAGGEGHRLRPLTAGTPKPMLPVGSRPILENTINLLVRHGFRRLFISINYLGEQIKEHFGDGDRFGCQITYLSEEKPLSTAGALSLLPERPHDPLLVLNGDLLTDVNLSALMDYHLETGCAATQCVSEYKFQIPFGVVRCENGQVVELEEKPVHHKLINAGIYILSPDLLNMIPANQEMAMPDLLARARREGHLIAAFPIRERWTDIGQLADYHWACQNWVVEENA